MSNSRRNSNDFMDKMREMRNHTFIRSTSTRMIKSDQHSSWILNNPIFEHLVVRAVTRRISMSNLVVIGQIVRKLFKFF